MSKNKRFIIHALAILFVLALLMTPSALAAQTTVMKYFDGRNAAMTINFDTELYMCGMIHSSVDGYNPLTAAARAQKTVLGWPHLIDDGEFYGIPFNFNICGYEAVFGDKGRNEVAGIDILQPWHSDPHWSNHTWYSDVPENGGNYLMTGNLSGYIQPYNLVYGGIISERAINSAVPFELSYHNFGHENLNEITPDNMNNTFRLGIEYFKRIGVRLTAETPPWNVNPQIEKYPIYVKNGIYVLSRAENVLGEPYEVIDNLWIVPRSGDFSASTDFRSTIDQAIANSKVFSHSSHPEDGFESDYRSAFQTSLAYARTKVDSGELWATTLSEVGRYFEAKSDVNTNTVIADGRTHVNITLTNYDVEHFGIPYLTFNSPMPNNANYAKIKVNYPSIQTLNSNSPTIHVVNGYVIYSLYLNPSGMTSVEIEGVDLPYSSSNDINKPILSIDSITPINVVSSVPVQINASTESTDAIYTTNIIYQRNNDAKDSKIMNQTGPGQWGTYIGPFDIGDIIRYYVSTTDHGGRRVKSNEKFFVTDPA
ncbi:MAG: hypothetical protein KAQ71_15650, partial [Desulfobulbaceae bacterium]|nr:hypothetical protein [Desulfobulbaceae bacterium]